MKYVITGLILLTMSFASYAQAKDTVHFEKKRKIEKTDKRVELRIYNLYSNLPIKGITVVLESTMGNTCYKSTTNKLGVSRMFLRSGGTYILHVDKQRNYDTLVLPKNGTYSLITSQSYEKIQKRVDKTEGDTIFQVIPKNQYSVKMQSLIKIHVEDSSGNGLNNIPMYLKSGKSSTYYKSISRNDGYVLFFVPIDDVYRLSFNTKSWIKSISVAGNRNFSFFKFNIQKPIL